MNKEYSQKHNAKSLAGEGTAASATATVERRNNLRWACSATAEVLEIQSGTNIKARTTDLGPGGCYVDTINTLTAGTLVRVRIALARRNFETGATVKYALPGMGMGLWFTEMAAPDRAILEEWTNEMQGGSAPSWEIAVAKGAEPLREKERQAFNKLIKLLLRKEILSGEEASSLLE
jgi:hypothetical protein